MRRLFTGAMIAAALVAGAAPPVALAAAPQSAQARETGALFDRVQALLELGAEASSAITSLDHRALMRPDDAQGMANLLAGLDRAQAQIAGASAKLKALPAWAGDPEDARLVAKATQDQIATVDSLEALVGDLRRVALAVKTGDKQAMQSARRVLGGSSVKLMDSQAAGLRVRSLVLPAGSSDLAQNLAQAAVIDGVAAILRGMFGETSPQGTAQRLRAAEATVREQVVQGRAALTREADAKRQHAAGPAAEALKAREPIDRMQGEIFASLDRSAGVLGEAAVRAGAAPAGAIDLRADMARLRAEETQQNALTRDQLALLQSLNAAAR